MLKYTICFLKKNNKFLLLNRNKVPNMGMWNGVGGKIEKNETPYESILREVFEETGIILKEVKYAGNVTWRSDTGNSGMYVFIAELPQEVNINTPIIMDEGLLDWKDIEWILNPDNIGVVSNMKMFLPKILQGDYNLEHKFVYKNGVILSYSTSSLPVYKTNIISQMK